MKKWNKVISIIFLAMMALGIFSSLWPGRGRNGGQKGDSINVAGTAAPAGENAMTGDGSLETLGGGYIYRREGGIAGFCDVVTVETGGAAAVFSCRTEPAELRNEAKLTDGQAARLAEWVNRLGSFNYRQGDPATADAMTITITFTGSGKDQPTEDDIAAMEALAGEVLASDR